MQDIEKYSQSDFVKAKQHTQDGVEFWYEKTTERTEDTENYYNSVISASSVVDYPYTSHLSEEIKKSQFLSEYPSDQKKFKRIGIDNPKDYAIFQNKGYQGLYNGLGVKDIHKRKGLDKNQKILDHMGSTESAMNLRCVDEHEKSNELVRTKTNSGGVSSYQVRCVRCSFFSYQLAANLFRATQTDDKLRRENIRGKENANTTHFEVGKKVRQTIEELGGTMPEDLELPEKSIQEIEEKHKKKLLRGELE